jgi:hypothetical protein
LINVCTIKTCQNESLRALQKFTCKPWTVQRLTTEALKVENWARYKDGAGWILYIT